MAGTRISAGTPTSLSGSENVPIGTGSGKTITTTQTIADLSRSYTTTATAAGTTTLTVSSTYYQYFTGITTQTITLPVTSTLTQGKSFEIVNLSTGTLTVNSSGNNLVVTIASGGVAVVKCILITGTTAASWDYTYTSVNPMTTQYDTIYGGGVVNGVAVPTRLANGTTGQFLGANTGGAPTWQTPAATSANFNTNAIGAFVITNSNAGTSTSSAVQFVNGSTTVGYLYGTLSNYATGSFASALVLQNQLASGIFIFSQGATIGMELDGNRSLRVATALVVGKTNANPGAVIQAAPAAASSAWLPLLQLDAAANTALTASTPFPDFIMNAATQTWGSGTIAIQPRAWIKGSTLAGTSGTNTATVAAALQLDPWIVGTNAAIINNYTLYSNGVIGYPFTYTAIGTTGNQTINKTTGVINIAASGTSVVLTNNTIGANSIVMVQIITVDTTAKSAVSVSSTGTCTITLNAAATGTVQIAFKVVN